MIFKTKPILAFTGSMPMPGVANSSTSKMNWSDEYIYKNTRYFCWEFAENLLHIM